MNFFNFVKKSQSKKGFTLVELLVVIAIIGILSTLAVVALGNVRSKARDAKRVADIKQIGTALELYYADGGSYPTVITPGQSLVSSNGADVYLDKIPSNPTPRTDGNCADADYTYSPVSGTTSYVLNTCIAGAVDKLAGGNIVLTPESLISTGFDSSHAQ